MSDVVLARRTELMIDSQTFSIMRDPQAVTGAQRITSPKLQAIFQDAGTKSGWPAPVLAAISYLESWGIPRRKARPVQKASCRFPKRPPAGWDCKSCV